MKYELGCSYIDRGGVNFGEDQFLRWINIPKSGMLNSPGIRPLNYVNGLSEHGLPAYLVLVTHEKSASGIANPWDDIVDLSHSEILYWGDSKFHTIKRLDDFRGNAILRKVYDYMLEGGKEAIPPILHFSKPEAGVVKFNGLCVLEKLEISWFYDNGHPVRNYHAHLTVLDCEKVEIDWLHHRAKSSRLDEIDDHPNCPDVWKKFKKGHTVPINIWRAEIRSRSSQLPPEGSEESKLLEQICELQPFDFEKVIVALFKELKDVTHHITGTRCVGDGGFDFFGTFTIQRPLNYKIQFRGEVKRYSTKTPVTPKEVSRLVARLSRKEYGIFVTTSYFSEQAQREVVEDGYPIHLIAGADLVNMMNYLRIASGPEVNQSWLETVLR